MYQIKQLVKRPTTYRAYSTDDNPVVEDLLDIFNENGLTVVNYWENSDSWLFHIMAEAWEQWLSVSKTTTLKLVYDPHVGFEELSTQYAPYEEIYVTPTEQ